MTALLISADLMTSSQIEGASPAVSTCPSAAALERIANDPPGLAIVDLTAPGVDVAAVVAAMSGRPVIAFGPHVHEQKLQAARDAGCVEVLTRGQFFRDPAGVIARYSAGA